jgi:hypothetical protein
VEEPACPFDRLILRQDFDELSRVAQDDPELSRTGKLAPPICIDTAKGAGFWALKPADGGPPRHAFSKDSGIPR